jgi:hypothetical protein
MSAEQQAVCAGIGSISGGNAYNVDNYAVSTGIVSEAELPYTQQSTSPQWPLSFRLAEPCFQGHFR